VFGHILSHRDPLSAPRAMATTDVEHFSANLRNRKEASYAGAASRSEHTGAITGILAYARMLSRSGT
jgi:hypothetical protein